MMLMKNQIIKLAGVAIACAVVSACDADFDNPVSGNSGNSGDADLSKFVTIGDSLTAGYADGALYLAGQESSYPAILAQQFAKVGGDSNFTQPLVSDNLGGLLFAGNAHADFGARLIMNAATSSPEATAGTPTTEVIGSGLNGSIFNNMGVPGAKSFHLAASGYGNPDNLPAAANPYFVRFSSSGNTTMIADAVAQQPSFFVMWIGNNDVLSYATSGGVGEDQLGFYNPALYGSNDITDPLVFANTYDALVLALKDANANVQGVLINIPDVKTIPYFTAVPYNAVPFDISDPETGAVDQATINALNTGYAEYNGGLLAAQGLGLIDAAEVAKRTISFADGQNAVVIDVSNEVDITDLMLTAVPLPSIRQATAADLLVLTASKEIPLGGGTALPLGDEFVLIPSEIAAIDAARAAFNATIKAAADADANLIMVDSAAILQEIKDTGIDYGTGAINANYATGGAFSLDGVHPTARGYAVMANAIIDAINAGFNARIPGVNPGEYTTIFVK
jgi:lysophospholipase L1-like esterase